MEAARPRSEGLAPLPGDGPRPPALGAVEALFARARRLGASERADLLASAGGEDPALREEVESLLRAHDGLGDVPEVHPDLSALPGLADEWLREGTPSAQDPLPHVGGFRLLRLLAAGGMGSVYLAEQSQPRRYVALKVLHPEAATPDGRVRFEHEAEALARLEHPGIARVYLSGSTGPPGPPLPFLAMELVAGRPLSAAVRELDLRARVTLLTEVAEAVAYAHTKGVVHRDLKPDNILVQGHGRPKIVDFGVARLLDEDDRRRTRAGQILGTLAYMSPEQAGGDSARADTRTDVYALGVVAYEALCGRHPLGERAGTFPELVRRIQEESPPDPAQLDRRLRGDLASILSKALAKEPDERYASASALAEDLRRHLRDEPVLARPLTGTYQVRRFLRRHKPLVVGAACTLAALVGGLVLALALANAERRQRERADASAAAMEVTLAERSIDVAAAAVRESDTPRALEALARVPADRRGWEWRYLHAATDVSLAARPRPAKPLLSARLGAGPARWIALAPSHAVEFGAPGFPSPSAAGPWSAVGLLGGEPFMAGRRGARVVAIRPDGTKLLDVELPTKRSVVACAGSADGGRLAIALHGGQGWCPLYVFELPDARPIWRGAGSLLSTGALAFDPTGRRLATASGWDGSVRVLSLEDPPKWITQLAGHTGSGLALAFSPDGLRLASGSGDQTAKVWQVEGSRELARLTGHRGEVCAVAFDPTGGRLATGGQDGTVRIWDLARGTCEGVLAGHRTCVRDLRFEGEGGELTSLAEDGERRWRLAADLEVLRVHDGPEAGNRFPYVYTAAYSPDGTRLATAGWDGTVRVLDPRTGALLRTIACGRDRPHDVAWTPDGGSLLGGRGRLVRWDARTGSELAGVEGQGLGCLTVTPDGRSVLTGGEDGSVRRYRLEDLSLETAWPGDGTAIQDLGIDPEGTLVATISEAGRVRVWSLGEQGPRWDLAAHERGEFGAVAFSPDGRWLATGGADGRVRLWEARGGSAVRELARHDHPVYALAWLPDGTRLVTGDRRGDVRLLDPATGHVVLELRGHGNYVYRLDVSPDGRTIASASGDNTARLWSSASRAERERARREALGEGVEPAAEAR